MDFFIGQNSSLPILKYDVNLSSLNYDITPEMWGNCLVTFSMMDANGVYVIANKASELAIEDRITPFLDSNPYTYTLIFKFNVKQTRKPGVYRAEFKVDFLGENGCGKITLPNDELIQIIVRDSITKTDLVHLN